MKILRPVAKQEPGKTRVLSIRIPEALHLRIQQATTQAQEAGYQFNLQEIMLKQIETVCRTVEQELATVTSESTAS